MIDKINSIGIMISNKCQLKCKYCYIKNNIDNIFNEKNYEDLFKNFLNNKNIFIDTIIKKFPNVNRYEFWGAEPLLYYLELFDIQNYIINNSNKDEILFMVSSNMAFDIDYVDNFLNTLFKLKKIAEEKKIKIHYLLQCSIDFPASRHNSMRKFENQKGSYNIVRTSYEYILSSIGLGLFNSDYFNLIITTNSVTSISDFAPVDTMIEQISNILKKDLEIYKEILKVNPNFQFNPLYYPSIANGINYSELDGKKIYYFYKYLFDFIEKNSDNIYLDMIPYYFTKDLMFWALNYFNKEDCNIYNCGCFDSYIQIDVNGNILPCHEFLHLNNNIKKDIIIGNIFDDDVVKNINLLNMIKDHRNQLNKSIDLFNNNVFKKYKKQFEKLSNREGYIDNVLKRMFKFYMEKECFAENFTKNKNIIKYNLKNIINIILPDTLLLMEKFIIKHEDALKLVIMNR